jgi:hypothetical protein
MEIDDDERGECGLGRRTFVDGDGVGDTITRVKYDTGRTTTGVQTQDSLDSNVESRGIECLKHNLSHLFPIGFGIEGGLGEENGVLLGRNTEFIVEGVVPDLLHVVPVGDDAVFDGVFQGEDASLGLGLVTNI